MAENTYSGLAGLKSKKEKFQREDEERNKPKANWFSIKPNETVTVRFLQELDESSPNYNAAFGKYLGAVEHQAHGPKGFMSRALDTSETDPEGRDFAAEMYKKTRESGWKKRENFYINVAVERADEVKAEILSRNMRSDFVDELVEFYEDNGDTITDRPFTITRKGSGPQTQWKIKEAKTGDVDISGVTPWALDEYAVRNVPYEDQQEFYMRNYTPDAPEEKETNSFVSKDDQEPDW